MINKDLFKDFKHTIGYILFIKIFLGYIFVVFLFTFYQIYTQYSFTKNIVLNDLINTEKSFHDVLATSIWHFDEMKIKSDVNAIIGAKSITGVSILTPLKEVLILKGTVVEDQKKYKEFIFEKDENLIFSKDLLSHSFELINHENSPNEVLAIITFYTKKSVIFSLAKKSISLILINSLFTSFVLWILFIYFANRLLTVPLRQLIKASKNLNLREYKEIKISLNTNYTHELNALVGSFNKMAKRITESYKNLQELNLVLENQKNELIEVNKHKDVFLANMSHELKTPLNSINVISSVMMKNKKDELSEKNVKSLEVINSCGNDLLYLINDVLDISKLEANELLLNCEKIDFYKMILELNDMFLPQIKEKKINFIFEYDKTIDFVYSDKNRVKQILKNLLSNSLKFVKKGSISLIIKDENEKIKILVKDDGIGIDENKLEHIFDRFKQVDGSTTRKYGGTGLGLAICKELSLLLYGDLSVESQINIGTIFTLILPKKAKELEISDTFVKIEDEKTKEVLEETKKGFSTLNEIKKKKILILNNDPSVFFTLIITLKKDFNILQAFTFEEFLKINEDEHTNISCFVLDITKLENENLEILKKLNNKKLIICEKENEILNKKENIFLKKPFSKEDFLEKIKENI